MKQMRLVSRLVLLFLSAVVMAGCAEEETNGIEVEIADGMLVCYSTNVDGKRVPMACAHAANSIYLPESELVGCSDPKVSCLWPPLDHDRDEPLP